jgi:hypothetical protein
MLRPLSPCKGDDSLRFPIYLPVCARLVIVSHGDNEMFKFGRRTIIMGIVALAIAAIGVAVSLNPAQSGPKTGQDDTGLSIPRLGL